MEKEIFPASLYNYLKFANDSRLEKRILDCGAGGEFPKLALFYDYGYEVCGIDIADDQIDKARDYSKNRNIDLHINKGDMREISFSSKKFEFVYSYNTIFHLTKTDSGKAIDEMYRVLKKGGLLYVNFLSIEDSFYGKGTKVGKGEFRQKEGDRYVIHSFYQDEEPDLYFQKLQIIYKEKKRVYVNNIDYLPCFLEYIAKKKYC